MEVKNGSMIQLSLFHEEEEKSIHIGLILEEKKNYNWYWWIPYIINYLKYVICHFYDKVRLGQDVILLLLFFYNNMRSWVFIV